MTSIVGCQTPLLRGGDCGVAAMGRCSTCGHAFCDSHRARTRAGERYADLCANCLARAAADAQAQQRQESAARQDDRQRIEDCVRLLDGAGGFGLQQRVERVFEYRRGLLGGRSVEKLVTIEPAWPVGDLMWKSPERWDRGEQVHPVPTGITRALELVTMDGPNGDRTIEAWSRSSSAGPLANDSVRSQVLNAIEKLVAHIPDQ